ncbi:TPA: flagellar hook-basal body complex protein, partial [Campylobacter coli]
LPGEQQETQIGQVELVQFINLAGLHSMGDNLYLETGASGAPVAGIATQDGLGTIRHGFIELSNVQLVEEMTDLITGQRAYEAGSKAITTSDDMLGIVNQLKR